MEQWKTEIEKYLDEKLVRIIISKSRIKGEKRKIQIRPILLKGALVFQAEDYKQKQVFHQNLSGKEALEKIGEWMQEMQQLELLHQDGRVNMLISKKGKITLKQSKNGCPAPQADLSHNRKKKYILDPQVKVPFLEDLGVQTSEGKIVHSRYDKFKQINRFLEFVEDILPALPKDREVVILDFGCGKSYLTFAMYYYLKELRGYPIRIIGLDLKEDVICRCDTLAKSYGYDRLSFFCGDIASYEGVDRVDMVVTLHACDLATDYAMEKAVGWGAKVILSVPCCQHELNRQIENPLMKPVFGYGLIKERMAALYTDAIRAQVLEYRGYRTQILEFIDMEHTPKNILIRAVRQGNDAAFKKAREKTGTELRKLLEFLQADPAIVRLLAPELGTGERAGTDE